MERKVNVVEDLDGNKIVVIYDIRFKGRQSIEGKDVFIWHDEHKKRNEYPFPVIRPYSVKNSFLESIIWDLRKIVNKKIV